MVIHLFNKYTFDTISDDSVIGTKSECQTNGSAISFQFSLKRLVVIAGDSHYYVQSMFFNLSGPVKEFGRNLLRRFLQASFGTPGDFHSIDHGM
jgi:hypothetical protein